MKKKNRNSHKSKSKTDPPRSFAPSPGQEPQEPKDPKATAHQATEVPAHKQDAQPQSFLGRLRKEPPSQLVILGLTAVLSASTIVYTIVTSKQLQATREATRITERPYVLPILAGFGTEETTVEVEFTNSGKSPAIDVAVRATYLSLGPPKDLKALRTELLTPLDEGGGMLPSGIKAIKRVPTTKREFQDAFQAVKDGGQFAFVFGEIAFKRHLRQYVCSTVLL
jgi:hypothetical protein